MAFPSPTGEKPEGKPEQADTVTSLTDPELSGQPAEATIDSRGSGDAVTGTTAHARPAETSSSDPEPALSGDEASGSLPVNDGMEHFRRLRRRLLVSTLLASLVAVPVCWLLFDLPEAISLLVGSVAGLLYLVLLARSVSRVGGDRRSVDKIQLLVPVVLVLASTRIPQLELIPALVGFLLYKPALLVQAYLDR